MERNWLASRSGAVLSGTWRASSLPGTCVEVPRKGAIAIVPLLIADNGTNGACSAADVSFHKSVVQGSAKDVSPVVGEQSNLRRRCIPGSDVSRSLGARGPNIFGLAK